MCSKEMHWWGVAYWVGACGDYQASSWSCEMEQPLQSSQKEGLLCRARSLSAAMRSRSIVLELDFPEQQVGY